MIKTIDKNGTIRFMTLINFERLSENHDGTRSLNKVRRVVDEKVISTVEQDIASFIEKKKCRSNPEKDCTCDDNASNNEIMAEVKPIEVPIIELPKIETLKRKRNANSK